MYSLPARGIRQMKKNKVKKKLIEMFYNAMIPSVLLYACSGFLNLVTKTLKHDLDRPRRICLKLIGDGENLLKPDIMYKNATLSLAAKIIKDQDHPLCSQYVLLPSGRRYRLPRIRTSRFRSTFVPSSIILMLIDALKFEYKVHVDSNLIRYKSCSF